MVATVILCMLCVHLLCFCVMFYLISTRLHGKKMGMEIFAIGNLLLGLGYILQLVSGAASNGLLSIINHTLTLSAPVVYVLGALHFFNRPVRPWLPLAATACIYTLLQIITDSLGGPGARHALLAATCSLLFFGMSGTLLYGTRSFAQDLRIEMRVFALLIAGIASLNAAKFWMIASHGLAALDMDSTFQAAFYIYMCFLGTVLPPSVVWLVLKRLTGELSGMASRDPLTGLLNRRGIVDALQTYFRTRTAQPAHLLMLDIDHFKQINDTYGHNIGDHVLSHVAQSLQHSTRQGDLICRLGGEEFVVICLETDTTGALQVAERVREAIASSPLMSDAIPSPIYCSTTIGVSGSFVSTQMLDHAMIAADAALYRGKVSGRNRVVHTDAAASVLPPALHAPASLGMPTAAMVMEKSSP